MRATNGLIIGTVCSAATRMITEVDPAARIIIVTNYDGADLREAARLAGACGYVLKEDLFEVRRLLEALSREQ